MSIFRCRNTVAGKITQPIAYSYETVSCTVQDLKQQIGLGAFLRGRLSCYSSRRRGSIASCPISKRFSFARQIWASVLRSAGIRPISGLLFCNKRQILLRCNMMQLLFESWKSKTAYRSLSIIHSLCKHGIWPPARAFAG